MYLKESFTVNNVMLEKSRCDQKVPALSKSQTFLILTKKCQQSISNFHTRISLG